MIEFRPLAEDDLPLVEEWLRRDHVARWWRDDIAESLAEYRAALEGREPTDHFMIVVDGCAIGMIQTYLVSDYPEWEEVVQVGEGVAGVDLMIGEEELIGRGLGPQILAEFARDVSPRPPSSPRSRSRTAARGARSRRPGSGTSATSRRTVTHTA